MEERMEPDLAIAVGMWLVIVAGFLGVVFLIALATGYWYVLFIADIISLVAPVTFIAGISLIGWGTLTRIRRRRRKARWIRRKRGIE
ncbi:MAG: hypothetical protein LN415_03820 [Candidatus Thermoplasmatota archaeon]|nr:hypothetical protein [Candidatus Thermoplasmatota archaeon]